MKKILSLLKRKEYTKGYLIHKTANSKHMLCKILNEYDNEEEALQDLLKLLTKKKSEKELLVEYDKKKLW